MSVRENRAVAEREYHIAFCVDNVYAEYIKVPILSIIENNPEAHIHFHVLTDHISEKNRMGLQNEFGRFPHAAIEIHKVDDTGLRHLKADSHWSIHAWYRLLLPEILADVDRVLYLDADTLILSSLEEIFSLDLTGKSIAGVVDIQQFKPETFSRCDYAPESGYVCSGVLMMNLDYWREKGIAGKIIRWASGNKSRLAFPDQDAINHVCRDTKIMLPLRYGILDCFYTSDEFGRAEWAAEVMETLSSPAIVHYAGTRPWHKDTGYPYFLPEWKEYNSRLHRPIKRTYTVRGLLKYKYMLWQLLFGKSRMRAKREGCRRLIQEKN